MLIINIIMILSIGILLNKVKVQGEKIKELKSINQELLCSQRDEVKKEEEKETKEEVKITEEKNKSDAKSDKAKDKDKDKDEKQTGPLSRFSTN